MINESMPPTRGDSQRPPQNRRREYVDSPAQLLLPLVDKVRQRKPGEWMTCCPAHDDHNPSLSIRECNDGTLLLTCFRQCSAAEIVHAVGLEMRHLFPPRMRARKPKHKYERRISPLSALLAIDYEALLISTIASDVYHNREVDAETMHRLAVAVGRIGAARELYR